MRLYKNKLLRDKIKKGISRSVETRDGVLWDVNQDEHYCRAKIQGSNEYVISTYPKNWRRNPAWLKPGCAVKIEHRSGVRGYVEVVGEGRAIPSPISGDSTPSVGDIADKIMSGMEMNQTFPESEFLSIGTGFYRINGMVYEFSGIFYILDTDEEAMGDLPSDDSGPILGGSGAGYVEIDPAPSVGYYRYDAFVIGEDGVIDYLKGTASTSSPVKPTVPGEHLLIGDYILVIGGVDTAGVEDIGRLWEDEYPSYLVASYGDQYLDWDTSYGNVQVLVKDQNGWSVSLPEEENGTTIQFISGTGIVSTGSESISEGESIETTMGSSIAITYTRNQTGTEYHPIISVTTESGLSVVIIFFLFDESGEQIK